MIQNMFPNGMGMNGMGMGGMMQPMNFQNMGMGGIGGIGGMNGMVGMGGMGGMGGMNGMVGMGGMNMPNEQMAGMIFGPNMNINSQKLNTGGNEKWVQGYLTGNNKNQEFGNKINCMFITSTGKTFTILIDYGKTINELIKIFFLRVENPDLINKRKEICFLYNAARIDFDCKQKVEDYFKNSSNVRIMVNDIGNLIGA